VIIGKYEIAGWNRTAECSGANIPRGYTSLQMVESAVRNKVFPD